MKIYTFLFPLFSLLFSCSSPSGKGGDDTATTGTITIAADESLRPIVEAEAEVFQSIYPSAHLNIIYTGEYDAIQMVCKDSARLAIVTRDLLPEEKKWFDKDIITPRYSPFAYDAIALIVNRGNNDTIFTSDQLGKILSGETAHWSQLNGSDRKIKIVFDNPGSGILRQLKDSLLKEKSISKNCFAVENNKAVIDYVAANKGALGLIGVSWISDQDDSLMHGFTQKIRVATMVPLNPESAEVPLMKPYQAYIALKQYPLWRKIQLVSREARVGLGTGFASFIASDRGQRIVLKSGLVPAQAPLRLVNINSSNIQ